LLFSSHSPRARFSGQRRDRHAVLFTLEVRYVTLR